MANKLPAELAQLKAGVEGLSENPPMPDLPGAGPMQPDLPGSSELPTAGFEESIPSPEEFEQAPTNEAPSSFEQALPSQPRGSVNEERIHEIAEAVINEK